MKPLYDAIRDLEARQRAAYMRSRGATPLVMGGRLHARKTIGVTPAPRTGAPRGRLAHRAALERGTYVPRPRPLVIRTTRPYAYDGPRVGACCHACAVGATCESACGHHEHAPDR